jgi:hypothetical protein
VPITEGSLVPQLRPTVIIGLALITTLALSAPVLAVHAPVSVSIKAQNLEGTRPDGGPVTLWLNFDVSGNDVSALAGDGKAFGSSGAHIEWSLTGSMDGDVVTLTGVATDANNPALIGMPGSMVANAATGTVTFSWTLTSGPFAGRSGIVQGEAKVDIRVN